MKNEQKSIFPYGEDERSVSLVVFYNKILFISIGELYRDFVICCWYMNSNGVCQQNIDSKLFIHDGQANSQYACPKSLIFLSIKLEISREGG